MTTPSDPTPPSAHRPQRWRRPALAIGAALLVAIGVVVLALGAFPVGLLRGVVENRVSAALHTKVEIGSVTRDGLFSYTPVVALRDVRIAQPAWAGQGDFVRVSTVRVRVPMLALLTGRFRPDRVAIDGARIAFVRDASGRANWQPDGAKSKQGGTSRPSLSDLSVTNTQIVLRDAKRQLIVAGPLTVDATQGLRLSAKGSFRETPATLALTGGRIAGIDPTAPYPFAVKLSSSALDFSAQGTAQGVLDTRHFTATIRAQAPTLKNLDYLIEAGLFGTQPIDLNGTIRHDVRDWYVDRLAGTIGRSRFAGRATVHKYGIRTAIDARIHASQFDFDDLADSQGRAESAARLARIGPRVIPPTRIDLSKLWKTDGTIRFAADRLLSKDGTVFQSLSGTLNLDNRRLTVSDVVATLANGRMTCTLRVDHRSGLPKLAIDMRLAGLRLERLVGKPDMLGGEVRGHIVLSGQGETVRDALAHGSGKAAIVATQGHVQRMIADVLGQSLSGAIAHAIGGPSDTVPLQCLVADFRGTNGVLVPRPLEIDTGSSVGRGAGRIVLDGERIDLTLAGTTKSRALLRITDPIRIGGTLSEPSIAVAGIGAKDKPSAGGVLKVLGRSIGQALGLTKTDPSAGGAAPQSFACAPAVAAALR
ncbi:AsmA family protein [Sphingomonas glacialis]|uniref:AsmA family protein n=1 Tax=Sphingomonas glacialis TaxID=658225 RepID=A0A502G379_9SPHN|nr:AsmA family protein [Sphingomonas glacialis]TPG56184.1 AsmA family protein [Sphingomonas glacialis]